MNRKRRIQKLSLLCMLLPTLAQALPEDSQASVEMRSGQVTLDQKNHSGVFSDKVELDQGSTHIRASKIITQTDDKNALQKAIIIGTNQHLAHYWSLMSPDKPELHAYAERIEYYPKDNLIRLIGQAHIEQGNNSFSAPQISFNTATQKVITEARPNERALIIFHPEKSGHSSPFTPIGNAFQSSAALTTSTTKPLSGATS